ncbi:MAG: PorT family protein [Bacteroidota bacterium]|nr:PorT family protein [Bacteroidota bacterium]
MKKIAVILLGFISVKSFGQGKLGIEAGFNSAQFSTSNNSNVSFSAVSSFNIGLLDQERINKTFFWQTGLFFSGKGTKQDRAEFVQYGRTSTMKLDYLQIPLNLGFDFNLHKGLKGMLGTGLYAAYGIHGTEKGYDVGISGTQNVDNTVKFSNTESGSSSETHIKPFDAGYNVLAGLEWKSFELTANYSMGLANIDPGPTVYKNKVTSIGITYFFK